MKKQNTAVNVITAIVAAFLSVMLVTLCIIIPVYRSLTAIAKPKQLVTLVQEIDYAQLVTENEGVQSAIEEFGIPADVVNDLMSSDAMGEIIGLFAKDISDVLAGKEVAQNRVTADAIKNIVNENIDEIADIAKSIAGEEVSDEDIATIKDSITKAVNENADEIVSALPNVKELTSVIEVEGAEVITAILGPTITIILIAIAAVIAGLIYACRFRNFNALLWLGIDFGTAALIVCAIAAFIGSGFVSTFITEMASINGSIVDSVVKVYSGGLITGFVILFVLCALFITGYVLLKVFVLNKNQAVPETVTEAQEPEQE